MTRESLVLRESDSGEIAISTNDTAIKSETTSSNSEAADRRQLDLGQAISNTKACDGSSVLTLAKNSPDIQVAVAEAEQQPKLSVCSTGNLESEGKTKDNSTLLFFPPSGPVTKPCSSRRDAASARGAIPFLFV